MVNFSILQTWNHPRYLHIALCRALQQDLSLSLTVIGHFMDNRRPTHITKNEEWSFWCCDNDEPKVFLHFEYSYHWQNFNGHFFFVDAKGSIREIILPKGLDLDRPKRTRTSFTAEQLYRLEMEFQRCQYVVGRERTELARQLNLSETQVNSSNTIHVPISLWPSVNKYQIHILCYHRYVMGHSTNRVHFG